MAPAVRNLVLLLAAFAGMATADVYQLTMLGCVSMCGIKDDASARDVRASWRFGRGGRRKEGNVITI